jgi:hypothetical protein
MPSIASVGMYAASREALAALSRIEQEYQQNLLESLRKAQEAYEKEWETAYGRKCPRNSHPEEWIQLASEAGISANVLLSEEFTYAQISPIIEGYLARLKQQRECTPPVEELIGILRREFDGLKQQRECTPPPPPPPLSPLDVAERLCLTVTQVYKLIKKGALQTVPGAKPIKVTVASVDAYQTKPGNKRKERPAKAKARRNNASFVKGLDTA